MKYNSLLATDMDYTLLMPGQDVSPENVRAVKALRANGVAFTLATGRSSYLVGKYAQDLEIDIPIITGNGGTGLKLGIWWPFYLSPTQNKAVGR